MAMIRLPDSGFSSFSNDRQGLCMFLTHLVCGVVLLGQLSAARAESVSAKLSVSVRVGRSCHIHTDPKNFGRYDTPASLHPARVVTRAGVTIDCGSDSDRAGMMAVTTESRNADKPIINVFSNSALGDQKYLLERMIRKTTEPDSRIIYWGLFPVDAQLIFSIPEHDRAGESALSEGEERTVKLVIDF
jgi:hypothetical protein